MSDWIESRTNLARHRKTRRFAELLDIPRPLAVGHLTCWWHRVMEESPEGDLSVWSAADIADAALYEGDAELFRNALVDAGFLETDTKGQRPHDWEDYAGRLLDRRRKNAERMRIARHPGKQDQAEPPRAAHVQSTAPARPVLPTGPDQPDQPDRTNQPAAPARACEEALPEMQDDQVIVLVQPDAELGVKAVALVEAFYEAIGVEPHSLTRSHHKREVSIAKQLVVAGADAAEARQFVARCRASPYGPPPTDLRIYEQKRAWFLAALEPVAAGPPGRRNGKHDEAARNDMARKFAHLGAVS